MTHDEYIEIIFGDNNKFTHHPLFPDKHWVNKNRHFWTEDEIKNLYEKYVGRREIKLNSCDVLIRPVDLNYKSLVIEDQKNDRAPLICGKVIGLGMMAFCKAGFPKGASATYNDYVLFNYEDATDWKIDFTPLVTVNDLDILGVIEDPYKIRNNNNEV
jgi:co-chaperonin GroES (HSP10)